MPDVPKVDDPVLAVVLDRLDRLTTDFKEHREETKKELAAIRSEQAGVSTVMTKAQGGYLVLLGLGAMATYAFGFWDKVLKLLGKA